MSVRVRMRVRVGVRVSVKVTVRMRIRVSVRVRVRVGECEGEGNCGGEGEDEKYCRVGVRVTELLGRERAVWGWSKGKMDGLNKVRMHRVAEGQGE